MPGAVKRIRRNETGRNRRSDLKGSNAAISQKASLQTLDEDTMNNATKMRGRGSGDGDRDGSKHDGANLRTSRGLPGDSMGGNDRRVASIVDLLSCPHANAMQSRNTNA